MGTWSKAPFGNDTASDWVYDLEKHKQPDAFIRETLEAVMTISIADAPEAEEAVAAAAVVSAAAVSPLGPLPRAPKKWVEYSGYVPSLAVVALAKEAIEKACEASDLRTAWEESGAVDAWARATRKLLENLERAEAEGLPSRTPKKKKRAIPRHLYKLLELYGEEPNPELRARIRRKFESLKDPNERSPNTNDRAPLSLAAHYGLLEEVESLIARGADPNEGRLGGAFSLACAFGHLEVAKRLERAGAHVFFWAVPILDTGVHDLVPATLDAPPGTIGKVCPALSATALEGTVETAAWLVSLGADLHLGGVDRSRLLHNAAFGGNVEMIRYLVRNGLNVDAGRNEELETPLHHAVRAGKLEAVECLLELGADPDPLERFTFDGHVQYSTPVDVIAVADARKIKDLLREHGALSASELGAVRSRSG